MKGGDSLAALTAVLLPEFIYGPNNPAGCETRIAIMYQTKEKCHSVNLEITAAMMPVTAISLIFALQEARVMDQ